MGNSTGVQQAAQCPRRHVCSARIHIGAAREAQQILNLEQTCKAGAKPSIMDWTTFQCSRPLAGEVQKRALWLLTAMMCGCNRDPIDKIITYRVAGCTQSTAAKRILLDLLAPQAPAAAADTPPGTAAEIASQAASALAAARPRACRPAGTLSAKGNASVSWTVAGRQHLEAHWQRHAN